MRSLRTQLAYIAAGITLILGLIALLNPVWTIRLVGLELLLPRGLAEVRATFGGVFTALGVGMVWAIPKRPRTAGWLRFAAVLWFAAATGRLLSIIFDPDAFGLVTLGSFALELFLGAASLLASLETPLAPYRGKSSVGSSVDGER